MNKMNKFFLMGTMALSGMAGLTACSSDDDVNGNGNDGAVENGVVKTQFAINVPKAAGTRMSAETAQDASNFRGLTDITLYPLTIADGGNVKGTTLGTQITLKDDFKKNEYASGTTEHKLYADVDVPIGTNHFLLYAQALENKATASSSVTDMAAYGVLNANGLSTNQSSVDNISFNLQAVKVGKFSTEFPYVLQALNNVVNLDAWVNETSIVRYVKLRTNLQSLNVGSATAIFNTMQSLCLQLKSWASSDTNGRDEQLARDIIAAVKDNFVVEDDVTYNVTAFKDQTLSSGEKLTPEATFPTTTDGSVTYTLPEGVANIVYTSGKFQQVADPMIGNKLSVSSLTYPSALYYFDDTALKANNTAKQSNELPSTATAWTTGFTGDDWYDAVAATTRTIVLKDNINYGVALLKVTAKCASGTLEQNVTMNTDGTEATTQNVDVPSDGFPVTAVLVGGQPDKLDWEFLPTGNDAATAAAFTKTVYDNTIPTGMTAKASTASNANYTILLDNRKVDVKSTPSSTNCQENVYLVLELKNNSGVEFNGANGIIKKDAKFYVVGTVSPYVDTSSYALKNWNGDTSITNPSIFMRDYVTTLNVSINSLKNAYNTIPDLRPTNLALGMSVDLEWQKGFITDVVIE